MYLASESDVQGNGEELKRLKALGYKFEISSDGYRVWFKDEYIRGAGVRLPRQNFRHWQHARADLKENLFLPFQVLIL